MADGAVRSIKQKQALLQYDFKRTKKEIEELDVSLELWSKQLETFMKIMRVGLSINQAKVKLEGIAEWLKLMEIHLEIIHQILAEEFILLAEDASEELVNVVKKINDEVLELKAMLKNQGKINWPITCFLKDISTTDNQHNIIQKSGPGLVWVLGYARSLVKKINNDLDQGEKLITRLAA